MSAVGSIRSRAADPSSSSPAVGRRRCTSAPRKKQVGRAPVKALEADDHKTATITRSRRAEDGLDPVADPLDDERSGLVGERGIALDPQDTLQGQDRRNGRGRLIA